MSYDSRQIEFLQHRWSNVPVEVVSKMYKDSKNISDGVKTTCGVMLDLLIEYVERERLFDDDNKGIEYVLDLRDRSNPDLIQRIIRTFNPSYA